MASTRVMILRRLSRAFNPRYLSSYKIETSCDSSSIDPQQTFKYSPWKLLSERRFCSNLNDNVDKGPAPIDYRSILEEDEFHQLADSTIHDLLEKVEEYGDSVDIDGFDIDYGNQVLTVKLGDLGTYVLNKQTPNRQIWMSSPVSGPSRFDWDRDSKSWIYRRNKSYLFEILESELEQLCSEPIALS